MTRIIALAAFGLAPAGAVVIHHTPERKAATEADWMTSGSAELQKLKQVFRSTPSMQSMVTQVCGSDAECAWQEADSLMCETLLKAGRSNLFSSLDSTHISTDLLSEKVDIEFAKAFAPQWKGEYRMRDAWDAFSTIMNGVKTTNDTTFNSEVDSVCSDKLGDCRKNAVQYIICQKVQQVALAKLGVEKVMTALEAGSKSLGDASDVLQSGDAKLRAREMYEVSTQISPGTWLTNGIKPIQEVKAKLVASKVIDDKIKEACAAAPHPDCDFMFGQALYCRLLEKTNPDQATLLQMETLINKTMFSDQTDGYDGVDWSFRSGLIAKWRLGVGPASELKTPLELMKGRVLGNSELTGLVQPMCWDLYYQRPGCYDTARQGLFCEALAQARVPHMTPDQIAQEMESAVKCLGPPRHAAGPGQAFLMSWDSVC